MRPLSRTLRRTVGSRPLDYIVVALALFVLFEVIYSGGPDGRPSSAAVHRLAATRELPRASKVSSP